MLQKKEQQHYALIILHHVITLCVATRANWLTRGYQG